ncbi:ABC transporter permease [Rubrobacter aplysinae]|uniref:ABC transporter permease n=1 Tax=Rubrobacter aplysinae TaxID=909625 RepID=UPI001910EC82|nr:ABC transporter permease [Rubrobacter aplysinae]
MDNEFTLEDENPPLIDFGWISSNLFDDILPAFLQHLLLALIPVVLALAIALPVGILCHRRRWLYPPTTAVTGILYTIPSLAFFVLLIPLVGTGVTPVLIALTAYSLLVLIRNVVTGLDSVPDQTIDAARGMGLTERQILFGVELPLALPVIVAGVRIATVTVVGIASIAAFIGGGGLGTLIFDGIDSLFFTQIIVGALLTVVIAVSADLGLHGVESRLRPWARRARGV